MTELNNMFAKIDDRRRVSSFAHHCLNVLIIKEGNILTFIFKHMTYVYEIRYLYVLYIHTQFINTTKSYF